MDSTADVGTVRAPRLFTPSDERLFRLCHRVALADAARLGGLSLSRASEIEREPARARPGELEKLRAGVLRAAGVES